jgi:5-guanidino-2-oxopentanoate decarboxylase
MENSLRCGQAAVALLREYGIDTVFGIPGVHTIEFYRGLEQSGLNHILSRHEQGAGFMADGYARASGRPAACLLITGPGLTNAATPIAQAYSDSQPMVVLASTNMLEEIGKGWGPFHEIPNQRLIADQMTCFSGTALSPDDIPQLMAQGWSAMCSGRPRPYYVEVPRDVLALEVLETWKAVKPAARPRADADSIQQAVQAIDKSQSPIILVGGGACDASSEITALAEKLQAPVISSFTGKGIVADSHPLSLGATLCMEHVRALVSDADAVIAIGTELSVVDSSNNRLDLNGSLIRIDVDARKINDFYPADVGIIADAASAALDIANAIAAKTENTSKLDKLKTIKQQCQTFGAARTPEHRRVLEVLRRILPDDGIVVGDMTQLAYSGNYCFPCERPRTWLHPASYATLGFSLPAAIGAKIAKPHVPVVSISGDYGFLFTCPEMATAAERNIPVIQILWNNNALGEIRDGMELYGVDPVEVIPKNPNYIQMARSFHWDAEKAISLDHLEQLLTDAIENPRPILIEVNEGEGDWAQ